MDYIPKPQQPSPVQMSYELKKDVTDLKKFIFEMAHNSNVQVPDYYGQEGNVGNAAFGQSNVFQNPERSFQSIMLNKNEETPTRVVEEPKSLADMEKDMITKSLAKHKNKRKNVAIELGISERTLYRKIKEYHIKE
jgi:DNA-binding NtrC family response regulator